MLEEQPRMLGETNANRVQAIVQAFVQSKPECIADIVAETSDDARE